MIRVLIVDDEEPTRVRLRQLLAAHADVQIAGEAGDGLQAMELASRIRPDLMILDIQMPGSSGIDIAACLPHPRPHIIFCTAFDQYAVDAFELHAVDYLLKPVSRARLADALERVRQVAAPGAPALDAALRGRLRPARFLVRSGDRYLVISESEALYFGTEGSLTRLVTAKGQYWMDPSLNDLEQRLDPARFFRISRAALVALSAIAEVVAMPGGAGEAILKSGERLEVSRRRFRDLLGALQGVAQP